MVRVALLIGSTVASGFLFQAKGGKTVQGMVLSPSTHGEQTNMIASTERLH
jgi:hypothetical protein